MIEAPKHMHDLSKIYWQMVDDLVKNNFSKAKAENIVANFFKQFKPLPRNKLSKK